MIRKKYIDSLRVTTVLLVLVFHCADIFGPFDWAVKNPVSSKGLFYLESCLWQWIMPLLFVLSGMSSRYFLKRKTVKEYILSRFKRIIVPLYTAGAFLILPPIIYTYLKNYEGLELSWIQAYPLYFLSFSLDFRNFPFFFWIGHLWFLYYLFLISLTSLPFLTRIKEGVLDSLNGYQLTILPALGSAAILITLKAIFWEMHGWAEFTLYAFLFYMGFMLGSAEKSIEKMVRLKWAAFLVAIACYSGLMFLIEMGLYFPYRKESVDLAYFIYHGLSGVGHWMWVIFWLGIGSEHLNRETWFTKYMNEAILPFYVLHELSILFIGGQLVTLPMGIPLKFFLLALLSFSATVLFYEIFIRRFKWIRPFFGMKQ